MPNDVSKGFVDSLYHGIIVYIWGGKNLYMFMFLYDFVGGEYKK